MRKSIILSASFVALTITPSLAFADEVVVEPEVQTWVMEQSAPDVEVQGDVVIGEALPDTVQVIEVPNYRKYRYAFVNKHRVIVDARTRKIIKVYE